MSFALSFPLDLWQNICTYLRNKRLIHLTTYFKLYDDYYLITTINFTYQKSSESESASATRASSHLCLSYLSATRFDFRRCFFEGPGSSSINFTSRVANSANPTL
jgi:hypothetical protein